MVQPSQGPPVHACTFRYSGRANRIITKAHVTAPFVPDGSSGTVSGAAEVDALWDTGATTSFITPTTVATLGLSPVGAMTVQHAGGQGSASTYVVSIILPNRVLVPAILVGECQDTGGQFGVLIGMDIISQGDFALTNKGGDTWLSFRLPSQGRIDFVQESDAALFGGVGRNDPCPCNSGKKYKDCHWKQFH